MIGQSNFRTLLAKCVKTFYCSFQSIGCADLKDIDGADIVRSKDVSTVTCHDKTQRSWTLSCNSTTGEWAGLHAVCEGRIKNQNTMITILELVFT